MPITSLAADLAFVLKDVGDAFTYGSQSGYGKLRRETISAATDTGTIEKVATQTIFVVADDAIVSPTVDNVIVIAGVSYVIRGIAERLPDSTRHIVVVPVS